MRRSLLRNIFNNSDLKMHEKQFKLIEDQLELSEKYIPSLTERVSEYSRKKAEEKKCLDKIVTLMSQYAAAEKGTLKYSIEDFSRILNQMNQHLNDFLVSYDHNVVRDLAEFKTRCKYLKTDLKTAISSAEQESMRKRQLQRLEVLRDQERERISAAEAELLKSKAENVKASKNLQQNADIFQQKKLMGLRASLLAWTSLELRYHARALELFTDAYQAIAAIDVVSDLEEFRDNTPTGEPPPRLMTVQQTGFHLDIASNRWSDPPSDRLRTNSRQSGLSSGRASDSSMSK